MKIYSLKKKYHNYPRSTLCLTFSESEKEIREFLQYRLSRYGEH